MFSLLMVTLEFIFTSRLMAAPQKLPLFLDAPKLAILTICVVVSLLATECTTNIVKHTEVGGQGGTHGRKFNEHA